MGIYSYIKGELISTDEDTIVVDNSGIGYEILCPSSLSGQIGITGDEVKVYLYQSVREDDIVLYGFPSKLMKDVFLQLITVSGIGPKVAHSICAQVEPDRLAMAVIAGDVKFLTSVKGLGKKGAERIVLELKDKLKKAGMVSGSSGAGIKASAKGKSGSDLPASGVFSDAVEALVVLGYKEASATEAVEANYEDGIELSELIKRSLKSMMR